MLKGSFMYNNKARKSKIQKYHNFQKTAFSYLLFFILIFQMTQCSGNLVAVTALLTA